MSVFAISLSVALALPFAAIATEQLSLSSLAPKPKAATDAGAAAEVNPDLDAHYVDMNGLRYIKFKSRAGVIYLPALTKFTPAQLDEAFCANSATTAQAREVPIAKVDRDLKNQWSPYTALVQQRIQMKCQSTIAGGGPTPGANPGDTPAVTVNPLLETGVTKQSDNADGTTSRNRVFSRPSSKPNLNLGNEF